MYSHEHSLSTLSFPFLAVDTETTRFADEITDSKRRTRHNPFGGHEFIIASICSKDWVLVRGATETVTILTGWLADPANHIVFHNCAFDIPVLSKLHPDLKAALDRAVETNRVHDTQILEALINIARGSATRGEELRSVHLKDLAKSRAGMDLSKDDLVRLTFGDNAAALSRRHLEYAADDAIATYRVFLSQYKEATLYANPLSCIYPIIPDATTHFGLLSESIQIKGALGFAWLEQFPLRVDLPRVEEARRALQEEALRFEAALVGYGFAHITPKTKKFHLRLATLRKVLGDYASARHLEVPRSDSGLLSTEYDFWARHLPRLSPADIAAPGNFDDLEPRLATWLRYMRVRKLLATYLDVYSTSPTHYPHYWNLGARTGRTSCSRPNIQNIPKHKDGIRALFIPSPGRVFLEGDFKAAELCSLAQVYHSMYGGSKLGDDINAGLDPHIETAHRLSGPSWDTADAAARKLGRQYAKAVNFGLPGGLGAAKFALYAKRSFGLDLTLEEARALRNLALELEPALRHYLEDAGTDRKLKLAARNLGLTLPQLLSALEAWRDEEAGEYHGGLAAKRLRAWIRGDRRFTLPEPPNFNREYDLFRDTTAVYTGRVRGRASYTEAHNTPFQGLVADGAKLALWSLRQAHAQNSALWSPVAFVHDSFLIECAPIATDTATQVLSSCMIAGLSAVCPDITIGVDIVGPMATWGPMTDSTGKVK